MVNTNNAHIIPTVYPRTKFQRYFHTTCTAQSIPLDCNTFSIVNFQYQALLSECTYLCHCNVLLETIIAEDETKKSILRVGVRQQLLSMTTKFDQFTADLNLRLANECLPIRIRSFSNTFSIDYLAKSESSHLLV